VAQPELFLTGKITKLTRAYYLLKTDSYLYRTKPVGYLAKSE